MPNESLTDQSIRRFPAGIATYWDTTQRGLGVRVSNTGRKTFIVLIGSGRRHKLGHYPALKLIDARKEAKRILAEKTLGSVKPTHAAFDDIRDEFLEQSTARKRTLAEYKRLLKKHFAFGRKSVAAITHRDIQEKLKGLPPSERRHAYSIARAFFRYCLQNGYIDRSPIEKVKAPPIGKSRERVLSPEELSQVWNSAWNSANGYGRIVALLILMGQRRTETASLERPWLSEDLFTLPSSATKNKREHAFPVGPMTLELLDRCPVIDNGLYYFPATKDRSRKSEATVFNNWSKSKREFDKVCGASGWTLHDIRRTFRTNWARLRISREVAETYINHVSGTKDGVEGIYDRYDYLPEMREAVVKWEQYLAGLLKPGTVPVP